MSENDKILTMDENSINLAPNGLEASGDPDRECALFQASMAERIGAGEDLQSSPHMQTCERCRALMSELETIVGAIRDCFPMELEPRDDLWSKIESKLAMEGTEQENSEKSLAETKGDIPVPGGLAFEGGVA